jgi:hypothetical protein
MLFVGFCGRFLRPTLGQRDPNEYAVDLHRSLGASPVRRDPPSPVVREQLGRRFRPGSLRRQLGLVGALWEAGRRRCTVVTL